MRFVVCLGLLFGCLAEPSQLIKNRDREGAELIALPIVEQTINSYTADKYGWTLPVSRAPGSKSLAIVAGNATNNPIIAKLGREGVDVQTDQLGEEGFRIVTYENKSRRYVLLLARAPVALKYAAQELVFFRMPVTKDTASVDWPINIQKIPQFSYRGIYMLPCWAQHDSVAHWRRVLEFNSELT
ncbi:MAG TPA: hypothetical protein VGK64_18620, partial [Bryobacteraceae bacterium]